MKVLEVVGPTDKEIRIKLHALRRKKKNKKPVEDEKPAANTFIDTFGGMAGYDSPGGAGSVSPD